RSLAHADATAHPCISVGHICSRALVSGQDMHYPMVETIERVIKRQARIAAQTEDMRDPVLLQHAHEGFGARKLVRGRHDAFPTGPVAREQDKDRGRRVKRGPWRNAPDARATGRLSAIEKPENEAEDDTDEDGRAKRKIQAKVSALDDDVPWETAEGDLLEEWPEQTSDEEDDTECDEPALHAGDVGPR